MFDRLLSPLAPHLCCSCGENGSLLCQNCNYDIIGEPFSRCVYCYGLTRGEACCKMCRQQYAETWCVGERSEGLKRLIDTYKFERVYAAHRVLAELLAARIGTLPSSAVVIPVPTTPKHRRVRGYDHMRLIARHMSKQMNVHYRALLERRTFTQQRGASRKDREVQARQAFVCRTPLSATTPYIIVDDVYTTGATVKACIQALRSAGARNISVAIVAYQPLDEPA